MITISEVRQKDAERAYQEYFQPEFRSRRLGSFGNWHGGGQYIWELKNPVQPAAFQNLVRGLSPDGKQRILEDNHDPGRVAFWQIEFSGSQSLSVLWAMSPRTWRPHIGLAQKMAALQALDWFERQMTTPGEIQRRNLDAPIPLSAFFTSGASHDQSPHLKLTAFVLAHGILGDGSAQKLAVENVADYGKATSYLYDVALGSGLRRLIGPFQREPGILDLRIVGVPRELVRRLYFDTAFSRDHSRGPNEQPLTEKELFASWRAQGKGLGWGEKEAKAFLDDANRRKLWADVKEHVQSRIQDSVRLFQDWKSSWKHTRKIQSPRQEEQSHQEIEKPRHRH